MTPWRAWKLYRATQRLFGIFEEGSHMSKPWYQSRTIWANVVLAAAELAGIIPLPGGTSLLIANVLNIALRFLTNGPTHLVHADE
jgi:cytochrome c oxidase assembly factor CtaG